MIPGGCQYDTTRTSPFGYYGTCRCGHVTGAYRETAKQAWLDVVDHVAGRPLRDSQPKEGQS